MIVYRIYKDKDKKVYDFCCKHMRGLVESKLAVVDLDAEMTTIRLDGAVLYANFCPTCGHEIEFRQFKGKELKRREDSKEATSPGTAS